MASRCIDSSGPSSRRLTVQHSGGRSAGWIVPVRQWCTTRLSTCQSCSVSPGQLDRSRSCIASGEQASGPCWLSLAKEERHELVQVLDVVAKRRKLHVRCGWFGHGVFPGHVGPRRSAPGDRVVSGRPERCDGERAGARTLTDAQQGRRQLPPAAAQGGRYRAVPEAGTVGCTQAEPPAASLPLLCGGMTSGLSRPGPGRPPRGLQVAGLHRVTAAARPQSWPGSFHQAPASSAGTRHCERHGHQRS
jgi:hypothetical protein